MKFFFLFPCIIFKVNFQLRGSEMPSCNITPCGWCVYWLLGLSEDLRERLKINKGPLLGYIDCLHLWLPVGLQSIQFRPPYKVRIVRRFLTLCKPSSWSLWKGFTASSSSHRENILTFLTRKTTNFFMTDLGNGNLCTRQTKSKQKCFSLALGL